MTTEFTPLLSSVGGFLIGLSAVLLMMFHGRIAGMTGIMSGAMPPYNSESPWRIAFLAGAILAPMFYVLSGGNIEFAVPVSDVMLVVGGLIVGVGVYFGSGCTSGHGVCGTARFSPRSIVATLVFMTTTFITVYVVRHVVGV